MPSPKNFSKENAGGESYELSLDSARVIVYRFGDRSKNYNWLSRRRQAAPGGFSPYSSQDLNDWAIKQSSYGSESENVENNPFISVATSYQKLYENGEIWVQKILEKVPNLGKFAVPFNKLFRPSPTKLISKGETEWLYYDGEEVILDFLVEWVANPYRKP